MTNTRYSDQAILRFQHGTLLLDQWSQSAVEKYFGGKTWLWDERNSHWRADAFQYASVRNILQQRSFGTLDQVADWQTVCFSKVQLAELRSEQHEAIHAWTRTQRGVVVMPTGTGKTEVALQIMANTECSTLIVAPIRDLMYQWHRRILKGLGYDAGIIGDSTFNVKPISVTTYDSACIHMPTLGNRFPLLIFDECHHLPGPIRSDAARMSAAPMRLGLTATPEQDDVRLQVINELVGPIVYKLDIGEVAGRSLADYEVLRIPVRLTTSERARYDQLSSTVAAYYGEQVQANSSFQWQELCRESRFDPQSAKVLQAFREKQSIEDRASEKLRVVEELIRLHHGTPMIIFAGSNAMARDVSLRFLIPCLLSHCGKRERLDYLEGLRDGVYSAIVANQVLDEGVDLPEVKVAIVIGGMASTRQSQQRLGRILRRRGNSRAVLYEVVCVDTNESVRSRKRRKSDAYADTRFLRKSTVESNRPIRLKKKRRTDPSSLP